MLQRLDPDAEELKDTIARVARLVLEREANAGQVDQARPNVCLCIAYSVQLISNVVSDKATAALVSRYTYRVTGAAFFFLLFLPMRVEVSETGWTAQPTCVPVYGTKV